MSTTQKTLLSCSAFCYILVLYSFFTADLWLILIFFILHSVSLLYFTYLSHSSDHTASLEEELNQLKEQFGQVTQENTNLERDLKEKSLRLTAAEEELAAALEREPVMVDEPALEALQLNHLLPPLGDNEDSHETIDIIKVAAETVKELTPFAEKSNLQMHISSPSDTLLIKANTQRIRILFRNIIDNSIKYMNRAGTLVITISTVGDDIFIVLKDNGFGLPEEETPHIFELNYQGSNRISGNGLGLTQAKAIVEYYGGTIHAKSTVGKGMGIYIQIPMN